MSTRTAIVLVAAAGLGAPAMAANLFSNGDFQMGSLGPASGSSFSMQNTVGSASLPVDSIYDEGTYAIVSYDTIHGNWVDFFDHTVGDRSGKYMIVNGSDDGSGPAWMQTVAVAPNTDYVVSGWFASLHASAIANLEWNLVGNASSTASPGFLAPAGSGQGGPGLGVWSERTFAFNSGANTSINFQLWDTSGIASGNDYAVDDLSLVAQVPAPASMATVALAGLVGVRRRSRRAR